MTCARCCQGPKREIVEKVSSCRIQSVPTLASGEKSGEEVQAEEFGTSSVMKRFSKLPNATTNGGDDEVNTLTIFSEENFKGESKVFQDNDKDVQKNGWKTKIMSLIVRGNPWIVYPQLQFKGMATFLEEGRYADMKSFPNLTDVPASIKFVWDDLGSPELSLFNSSSFDGQTTWEKLLQDPMKCVSVGAGGIWAVRAKDESIWVRIAGAKQTKLQQDTETPGDNWTRVAGNLRQVSVGSNSVWGVKSDGGVIVRMGICEESPLGKDWVTVDGEPMKQVCVSNEGHVWGVDASEKIWYRKGANKEFALGTNWKMIPGSLKQISIGDCGVWGINAEQQVWFRLNTTGDPDNEGTGWLRVEGRFQQVYSSQQGVFALAGNRDLYYRVNVSEKISGEKAMTKTREGTHWIRLEQNKDDKIIFKQFELSENEIWAIDKDNVVFFKTDIYNDINPNYTVTVFGDESEFGIRYTFPEKAMTGKVSSGGWAIYAEADFKGKVLYQVGTESYGNDPPAKENIYKTWYTTIGSARPIRGNGYRTPILKMTLDWNKMKVHSTEHVLFEQEVKNDTEDYIESPWIPTFDVETTASHKFVLTKAQNCGGLVRGCEFHLPQIEPIPFHISEGPELFTGDSFQQTFSSLFTFKDEIHCFQRAMKTKIVKLPPLVPPKCTFKAKVIAYRCHVHVPYQADFKVGFSANFENGSESWLEDGLYEGEDDSNVKVELACVKMPQPRKVSRMINGLGEDM